MSILTYVELVDLVYSSGAVHGCNPDYINGASIDVTLGPKISVEIPESSAIDLTDKTSRIMNEVELPENGSFCLAPGAFILAQTNEIFFLPNDIAAEFRLNSSSARYGLDQALAVWCDPGWHNSVLTIELRNNLRYHTLVLKRGQKIGQMIFHRGKKVPNEAAYGARGRYNNTQQVTQSLGVAA